MVLQGNHCGKLANEMTFTVYLRFGLPFKMKINMCDIIGRRLGSPASYIFMKTRFCQVSCPRCIWSVTEESTVVGDDELNVNRISDYRLDPISKYPGHMTLPWQSVLNVVTVDSAFQRVVNEKSLREAKHFYRQIHNIPSFVVFV